MAALGLTDADGMAQVWFVGASHLHGGAAAINGAFHYCGWLRPLTFLYKLPLIHQLENWIYQWVANNRHRMPGSTASCEIKGGVNGR